MSNRTLPAVFIDLFAAFLDGFLHRISVFRSELPAVWARIAWRSFSLMRLSLWTKSAATSSLAGGSDFRSSTMFSRGLTTPSYTGVNAMATNSHSR